METSSSSSGSLRKRWVTRCRERQTPLGFFDTPSNINVVSIDDLHPVMLQIGVVLFVLRVLSMWRGKRKRISYGPWNH